MKAIAQWLTAGMLLVGGMCTGPTLVKTQGERLLAMVLDGLRVSPDGQPLAVK